MGIDTVALRFFNIVETRQAVSNSRTLGEKPARIIAALAHFLGMHLNLLFRFPG
jgi:hypothetical protein